MRGILDSTVAIASWGPQVKRPVLMIGAANVVTGMLAKFISNREAIRVEHVLASCAVPRTPSGMAYSLTIRRFRNCSARIASVRTTSPRRYG
jgi:hypothetical protein